MTQATLGYGSKLKLADAGGTVYADIGEIVDSLDDDDSVNLVEVTNHQSPGKRAEYISGFIEGSEVTITCNYIPTHATHNRATGLLGLVGTTRNFRIEEPGNSQGDQFSAVIMNVGRARPVKDAMQLKVTIKKSGAVTQYTVV